MIAVLRFFVATGFLVVLVRLSANAQTESVATKGNQPSFEIAPVPGWVKKVTPGDADAEFGGAGTLYLLVDRQENLDRHAFYYHETRKITSENGVQNGASISASVEPPFEKLTFHFIQVTRNGIVSNRLVKNAIKMLQREKDPDRLAYGESYSAETVLDDVRVGDVIDFAYSTEGVNPLNRGKFNVTYSMQWEVPIVRNVFRFFYPANRNIHFRTYNGAPEPVVTSSNGTTEIWIESERVPRRKIEEDAPNGFNPRQSIEISDFDNWAEVAQWALPMATIPTPRSPEFRDEVNKLRAQPDPENRIVAALQFVQDAIRLVNIRSGLVARIPTEPDETLRRRFGDNRDKALLFVALLRELGIDAAPAVVSDLYRETVCDRLASPGPFDRMIVEVRLNQATHWVDPSRSAQRGPLSQVYVGRFGYGLVLRPETKDLVPLGPPAGSFSVKKYVENYRVSEPGQVSDLEVISEYRGLAADRVRTSFREKTREEIQKQYLEYYTSLFPETTVAKALWYEELPGENACRVTETYLVSKIWDPNDDGNGYVLRVQPGDIANAIGAAVAPNREDPLDLDYPKTIVQELNVEMFEDWPLNADPSTMETGFFRLLDAPTGSGSHLQFSYRYETLKDRVEVSEFPKYNEAVNKAKDSLAYTMRYQTPEQLEKAKKPTTINWAVGSAAICFLALSFLCGWRVFVATKLPAPVPPPIDAPGLLNGIGGWLGLLAVGHLLRPLVYLWTGFKLFPTMFNTESWRSLTDPIESGYHSWWAPTLLFELFYNMGAFVFCCLLIVLFFGKRQAWPRYFVIFLVISVFGVLLDTVMAQRIPAAAEPITESILTMVPVVIPAAIWIPYVFLSKRVKATFRY